MELKKVKPGKDYHFKVPWRVGRGLDLLVGCCIDNGFKKGRPIRTPVEAKLVRGTTTYLVPARNIVKEFTL